MSMIDATQFGDWERVGDVRFRLDASVPAVLYRWHAPERYGPFVVEFQCVESKPNRRFYPVEVLDALTRDEPADDFVARVCRLGIEMLPEMERSYQQLVVESTADSGAYAGKMMPSNEALAITFALFESRRTGHSRVTRPFRRGDDFDDTTRSRHRPESLIPGIKLPKRTPGTWPEGMDIVREVQKGFAPPTSELPLASPGRATLLDITPLRTPLDRVLIEGTFRDGVERKALSFRDITRIIAPALIAGVDVEGDAEFLAEHIADFRHFLLRIGQKHIATPAGFYGWLRTEREKGFTRLLPGWKKFGPADREAAAEKGKRFYRRVLWTAYESMSRCYGAVALWAWMSFCEAKTVINATLEEERAFRWYQSPLVCTAGMPLWFFGPNVLRWVMEPLIELVWGHRPDRDFDSLTQLIGLYGQVACDRRMIDAAKKRSTAARKKVPSTPTQSATVYEETSNGSTAANQVPICLPDGIQEDVPVEYVTSRVCPYCSGRLDTVRRLMLEAEWICQPVECVECGKELIFRTPRPR